MRLTTGKRLGTGKYGRFQADEALLLPYVTNHFVFHIGRYTLPLPCLFDLAQQFPNQRGEWISIPGPLFPCKTVDIS